MAEADPDGEIDREALVSVLEEHPVSLAVLFGSVVDGEIHPNSDVDVAVEFEDDVAEKGDALVSLVVDLTSTLQRDDVDIGVLNDLEPRIGRSAVESGEVLLGDPERLDDHRERFEAAIEERPPPGERFDAVIERVDEALQG
jgi:predicted nucleotidyltransferase